MMTSTVDPGQFITLNAEQQTALLPGLVADLVSDWPAERISGVTFLPGGYSNLNFAFTVGSERYVIRIPLQTQPFVDRRHEQHWYPRLPSQLSVSPILLDHRGVMVTPWIEGRLLIDHWQNGSLDSLAAYLDNLHQQLPDPERHYHVPEICQALGHAAILPDIPGTKLRPCHNDLNPWNILVTDEGWITLDWEFAGTNDPLFDLVSLHQGLELPLSTLEELAAVYLQRRDEPSADLTVSGSTLQRRLKGNYAAFWHRELAWAQYQINRGNRRQEIVDQAETARDRISSV